ncbi:MAG: TonB-dependent receptor, partial [Zoogloea sp.]|nr:TonB-dependent receptor [Zoogloea sp.]
RARDIGRGQARQAILDQYLRNVIAAPLPVAARVFKWTVDETRQAVALLRAAGFRILKIEDSSDASLTWFKEMTARLSASAPAVTFQAFLGNDFPTEMQVLVDGRSVYAPGSFGGVDWSFLPLTLDEVERIEVVRGTNPNAYGANAFLGVINIITRHSSEEPGTRFQVNGGSAGIRDLAAGWAGGGGAATLRISYAGRHDDGFSGLNDTLSTNTLTLRSDARLGPDDELTLRAGFTDGWRGLGYPVSYYGNNAERTSDQQAGTLHLSWRHSTAAEDEWLVNMYVNRERATEEWMASAPPAYPVVPLNRNRDSVRRNLEIQHRAAPMAGLRVVWGLEVRRDETDSPFLFAAGKPPAMSLQRLFGNLEWRAGERLTFNLGTLLEKNSGSDAHLIPRAFVNFQASPGNTLRAGFSQAYRQPNLFQLYGDVRAVDSASGTLVVHPYLPNPTLRESRIDSLEVGYLGRLQALDATLDVRVFNERITDFIYRATLPPAAGELLPESRYENLAAPFTLRGVETQLQARPWSGTQLQLTHTLIDRRDAGPDISQRTPPYAASVSWLQDLGRGFSGTLSMFRMASLAGGDGYVPQFGYLTSPYTTWDAHLDWEKRYGGRKLRIGLTAQNIGPQHQEIPDRSIQALVGSSPANPVSRMVWLSVGVEM